MTAPPETYYRMLSDRLPGHGEDEAGLKALVQAINEGRITSLIIMGGNPVYTAPASMDFAAALAKVEHTVHFSEYADETAAHCGWHVPRAHAFEAWTDALGWDGTHLIGQPGIAPIWGALSTIEFLHLMLPANEAKPMDLVAKVAGVSGKAWQAAVHDGKTANKVLTATTPRLNAQRKLARAASAWPLWRLWRRGPPMSCRRPCQPWPSSRAASRRAPPARSPPTPTSSASRWIAVARSSPASRFAAMERR